MDIYQFLSNHNIPFERYDHPPVFTCEEANRLVPSLAAAKTKNLFLCDGKGRRHFLVVVGFEKRVDLKALSLLFGLNKLRFASPKRLVRCLGVDPGAVSILGVMKDSNREVAVIFDKDLWGGAKAFQCHPLVNTSTLLISKDQISRFLTLTGHEPRIMDVPHHPAK
jgi:Ala-tRNA(Pro) deacylase